MTRNQQKTTDLGTEGVSFFLKHDLVFRMPIGSRKKHTSCLVKIPIDGVSGIGFGLVFSGLHSVSEFL